MTLAAQKPVNIEELHPRQARTWRAACIVKVRS